MIRNNSVDFFRKFISCCLAAGSQSAMWRSLVHANTKALCPSGRAAFFELYKERTLAVFILFHTFSGTDDLTAAVFLPASKHCFLSNEPSQFTLSGSHTNLMFAPLCDIFQELGFQRVAVGEGQKAVLRQIKKDIAERYVS